MTISQKQSAKPLPPFIRQLRYRIRIGDKTMMRMVIPNLEGAITVPMPMKLKYRRGDICYLREPLQRFKDNTLYADDGGVVFDSFSGQKQQWIWNRNELYQVFFRKQFARTFVRIVSAKVERLQDISEKGAGKEGATLTPDQQAQWVSAESRDTFNRHAFRLLWDSINAKREGGKYAWAKNPWVACYEWELLK